MTGDGDAENGALIVYIVCKDTTFGTKKERIGLKMKEKT